jgi:hypothetical protein
MSAARISGCSIAAKRPPFWHCAPVLNIMTTLNPFFGREHDLFRKVSEAARNMYEVVSREVERCSLYPVIQADRLRNGLGHPVDLGQGQAQCCVSGLHSDGPQQL